MRRPDRCPAQTAGQGLKRMQEEGVLAVVRSIDDFGQLIPCLPTANTPLTLRTSTRFISEHVVACHQVALEPTIAIALHLSCLVIVYAEPVCVGDRCLFPNSLTLSAASSGRVCASRRWDLTAGGRRESVDHLCQRQDNEALRPPAVACGQSGSHSRTENGKEVMHTTPWIHVLELKSFSRFHLTIAQPVSCISSLRCSQPWTTIF